MFVPIQVDHAMLYLKCTAEIQKVLKLSKASLAEAQPSTAPLGNWYINRFKVGRHNCFVFMSENTYLSFIMYQGKKPVTATTLPNMMLSGIAQLLEMRGYSNAAIDTALTPYHSGLFAKTDSRSVLGVLNDLVFCYRAMIEVGGGLQSCNLTDIILKINTMPQRTLQWAHAWDAVQAKLGNPETKH